jgi:hypothetical protein
MFAAAIMLYCPYSKIVWIAASICLASRLVEQMHTGKMFIFIVLFSMFSLIDALKLVEAIPLFKVLVFMTSFLLINPRLILKIIHGLTGLLRVFLLHIFNVLYFYKIMLRSRNEPYPSKQRIII